MVLRGEMNPHDLLESADFKSPSGIPEILKSHLLTTLSVILPV
jgi:hypothetical protein